MVTFKTNRMKKILFLTAIIIPILISCQKEDYIIGGEANETNQVDQTTFNYLKSSDVTNETAQLIELAGIQDEFNGDVTVLAPSNLAVRRYLRRLNNQALRLNPDTTLTTLNDLSADSLSKYLKMYIVDGDFSRDNIPEEGIILPTHLAGDTVRLSLDQVNTDPTAGWDGGGTPGAGYQYSNFMQSTPYLVHVHYKRGTNWEMTAQERSLINPNSSERDQVYRMYVSDVLTTTGVVHVIYCGDYNYSDHYYYHSLFFYGTTDDDLL